MIKKFIKNKKPFAVIKYYEKLKFSSITNSRYDILYLDVNFKKVFRSLNNDDLSYFKSIKHNFDMVVSNDDGTVWEWLNFKSYSESKPIVKKVKKKLSKKLTKK